MCPVSLAPIGICAPPRIYHRCEGGRGHPEPIGTHPLHLAENGIGLSKGKIVMLLAGEEANGWMLGRQTHSPQQVSASVRRRCFHG